MSNRYYPGTPVPVSVEAGPVVPRWRTITAVVSAASAVALAALLAANVDPGHDGVPTDEPAPVVVEGGDRR